jgi:pimeloyl-ACP methyl ester carboxylesterase
MDVQTFYEDNAAGWLLEIKRHVDRERLDTDESPVVMIPGYCMNTFVLGYHPSDVSMVEYLVAEGFEVWTANLRGQGGSLRRGGSRRFGFRELALVDVPLVVDRVLRSTHTTSDAVHAIGCSLGASVLCAYVAHRRPAHRLQTMVALGGPIRWVRAHPLLRIAFRSPKWAGRVPIRGTRKLARRALPLLQKMPWVLSIYMNPNMIDLTAADQLVKTVDDPIPYLNRQIAHWVTDGDLVVDGLNICEALVGLELPTLCVVANQDGIVPVETALSLGEFVAEPYFSVLRVGDEKRWFAHADLFINELARPWVFSPMSEWLREPTAGEIFPKESL